MTVLLTTVALALLQRPAAPNPASAAETLASQPASTPTSDAETPASTPASTSASPDPGYRQLVVANMYGLGFGLLYPIPSGELSLFLGSELRPRRRRSGGLWRTALGYRVTLSAGYADLHYADSPRDRSLTGILFHRHALAAVGLAGRRERLYYAMSGAVVFGDMMPIGAELEGQLGWVFTRSASARLRGVLGGQARLGGPFGGVPLPQLGLFIGLLVF